MHIYDLVDIYRDLVSGNHKNSLDIIQAAEDQGIKKMVECLVEQGFNKEQIEALCSKKSKGRKPESITNPIAKKMLDGFGKDNGLANLDDAITGVCHSFEKGKGSERSRLSKRKLSMVLKIPVITTSAVKDVLFVGDAQARRYIKAVKILITVLNKGNK